MLKLRHALFGARTRKLSPVLLSVPTSDQDELIQSIENEYIERDDNWQLTPTPDTVELESFWSNVSDDIAHDPTWQRFDDE